MSYSRSMVTSWGRWTATFIGFPLAGFTARLVVGGIDSPTAGIVGGLVGGAVLGAVQVGIGGIERPIGPDGSRPPSLDSRSGWRSGRPSSTTAPTPPVSW